MSPEVERLNLALRDRYRVERELGRGGMAVVYLAHDLKHDRSVALKVLRPELAAAVGVERFLREITLTARLNHPHIVPLLDSGDAGGLLYYVMPYVEGESLRARLAREKRIPMDEALAIAREVADALGYAHAQEVLHRDIKPENILLSAGHARVADFGIARVLTTGAWDAVTAAGVTIGTPAYMSPEQASGRTEVDARTDVYSLGCVAYEMLAGVPPFSGLTPEAMLSRKCVARPVDLRRVAKTVPRAVEAAIMRALAGAPAERYASAGQMAEALDRAVREVRAPAAASTSWWRPIVSSWAGRALLLILIGLLGAGAWMTTRAAAARRAVERTLPEIRDLLDRKEFIPAFRLAMRSERDLASNPEFQRLWHEATLPLSIRTVPAGARVYFADYREPDGDWMLLGESPIEHMRVPAANHRFRIEKSGFQTWEGTPFRGLYSPIIEIALAPQGQHPEMINVPGGSFLAFWSLPAASLDSYRLDRFEVTNRQFKQFVDRGGYRERRFWTEPITVGGRGVDWEAGLASFVDGTGRPGPSTWQLGTYAEGRDDYPVGGVSWYEASAYCAYAGKRLPTIYHWYHAAGVTVFNDILALSNIGGRGSEPAPVGRHRGIGPYGHHDIAGNVREWVVNPVRTNRYILGGAWSDPAYMVYHPDASAPSDRSAKNGFRCASYGQESSSALGAELDALGRYSPGAPIADEVFRAYRSLYSYEKGPVHAQASSADEGSPHWRREIVSIEAPYGQDRLPVHLFLPKTGGAPFQAVIYYPGAEAFGLESTADMQTWVFEYIVRTGRAVVHPIYEGTYGRRPASRLFREQLIHWTMDVRRTMDYLETRTDIDATKVAYYGFSAGAVWGPLFMALEPRFRASVLLAGGFFWQRLPPDIQPANFAPRTTVPVLMINGRDDFFFPVEDSQRPLFRLLGASDQHKRHALMDGGHLPADLQAMMRETLAWLDRYLGPVP